MTESSCNNCKQHKAIMHAGSLFMNWLLGRSLQTAWCKVSCWSPPRFHSSLAGRFFPSSVLQTSEYHNTVMKIIGQFFKCKISRNILKMLWTNS